MSSIGHPGQSSAIRPPAQRYQIAEWVTSDRVFQLVMLAINRCNENGFLKNRYGAEDVADVTAFGDLEAQARAKVRFARRARSA